MTFRLSSPGPSDERRAHRRNAGPLEGLRLLIGHDGSGGSPSNAPSPRASQTRPVPTDERPPDRGATRRKPDCSSYERPASEVPSGFSRRPTEGSAIAIVKMAPARQACIAAAGTLRGNHGGRTFCIRVAWPVPPPARWSGRQVGAERRPAAGARCSRSYQSGIRGTCDPPYRIAGSKGKSSQMKTNLHRGKVFNHKNKH